eukprot:SAG22_NODE_15908_length_337_cov_0.865546_1_plen_64_part_10
MFGPPKGMAQIRFVSHTAFQNTRGRCFFNGFCFCFRKLGISSTRGGCFLRTLAAVCWCRLCRDA